MSREKLALSGRAAALLGAGGLAALGIGGGAGYAAGKHRYEPGDPFGIQAGGGKAIFGGPRYALDELRDDLEDYQRGELGPAEIQQMVQEAQGSGVNMKMASETGKRRARSFADEMSKVAATCATTLLEAGLISKKAAAPYLKGCHDLQKCAQMFRTVGVAAYLAENQ